MAEPKQKTPAPNLTPQPQTVVAPISDTPAPKSESAANSTFKAILTHPLGIQPQRVTQLQRQIGNRATRRLLMRRMNQTGLPDELKERAEGTSGVSLEDVRVHPDSAKPADFYAEAYTQGTDIHVAPGASDHLAHEAWHVVQQKQGRVNSTAEMRDAPVNDDLALEHEAESFASGRLTSITPVTTPANAAISRAPIQFYDPKGLASFFTCDTIPALKTHIGEDTYTYLVQQVPLTFNNIMPFFQTQRLDTGAPIVNAEGQGEFLKAHSDTQQNLQLAKIVLRDRLNYNPTRAEAIFGLLLPHYNTPRYGDFEAILTRHGNDPVAAGPEFTYMGLHLGSDAEYALAGDVLARTTYEVARATQVFALLSPYLNSPRLNYFQAILTRRAYDPVAAGPEFIYMAKHLGSDEEFALADECLTNAGYNALTAEPIYDFLAKYKAKGDVAFKAAKRFLLSKGNDPVEAEKAMVATQDYGYIESVAQNAQTMTTATTEADIQSQLSEQDKKQQSFIKKYESDSGLKFTSTVARGDVKTSMARGRIGGALGVDTNLEASSFRDKANEKLVEKRKEFSESNGKIEGKRGGLEAKYGLEIKNALTPLYTFDNAEAAANWCITNAGTDVELLKKYVAWMVDGLTAKLALGTLQTTLPKLKTLDVDAGKTLIKHHGAYLKLDGLTAEKALEVIKILAKDAGSDGDLDVSDTERILTLLSPLAPAKIHSLIIDLLEPSILASAMLELVTNLKVDGAKIDTFIRKYVPGIEAKVLWKMVNTLQPLTDVQINEFVAFLHPSLTHTKVAELVEKLKPLNGTQQKAFIPKLQTVTNPLTGKEILELVVAMEGTPGDKLDETVTQFTALGDDTGKKIAKRVSDMRGDSKLAVGKNKSKDLTELDGERLLSGDEIAIRAEQVKTGALTADDLMKYPYSNINPVGRDEDLLWEDCDLTVSRDGRENAADKEIRKKLAFNQICKIGGVDKQVAQQVVMENDGKKPRDMDDASTEDGRSGGHTADRHVIGSGQINTLTKLQNRADGVGNLPPCPDRAGAYANMGASQSGMHNAMQKAYTQNLWKAIRKQIIRKLEYEIRLPVAVSGHVARKNQPMNNAPSRVYLPVKGANVKGGFEVFHSWPEI